MAWQAPAPHQESCHQLRLPSLVQLKDALNAMVDGSLHILAQETASVSSLEVGLFACAQIQLRLRSTMRLSRVTSTSFGSKGTTLGPRLATAIKSPPRASLDKRTALPPGCAAPAEAQDLLASLLRAWGPLKAQHQDGQWASSQIRPGSFGFGVAVAARSSRGNGSCGRALSTEPVSYSSALRIQDTRLAAAGPAGKPCISGDAPKSADGLPQTPDCN